MQSHRVNQQAAYVLHTRPYTESSLIVEFFSKDYGRLAVLSKGARSQKTRKRGILQPFQPLLIGWSGKGELPILTNAEQDQQLNYFDYKSRVCGFYASELLYRLLQRRDPHAELFDAYHLLMSDLDRLSFQKKDRELSLRVFEKKLLIEIGYGLILDREIQNNQLINPDLMYHYIPERGPEIYQPTGEYSNGHSSPLVVPGLVLMCINRNQYPNDLIMQQAKLFMRYILKLSLGAKPIQSRSLLYLS